MPTKRDNFDHAAADAANARISAQVELAKKIAEELVTNPARFDPKLLAPLGSQGFLVLMAAIRQHDVHESANQHYAVAEHADARMEASSWRHLRKPEPNRWPRSVAVGAGCGLLIIALGLAVAMFS
jgi:hypothetical protein